MSLSGVPPAPTGSRANGTIVPAGSEVPAAWTPVQTGASLATQGIAQ